MGRLSKKKRGEKKKTQKKKVGRGGGGGGEGFQEVEVTYNIKIHSLHITGTYSLNIYFEVDKSSLAKISTDILRSTYQVRTYKLTADVFEAFF